MLKFVSLLLFLERKEELITYKVSANMMKDVKYLLEFFNNENIR